MELITTPYPSVTILADAQQQTDMAEGEELTHSEEWVAQEPLKTASPLREPGAEQFGVLKGETKPFSLTKEGPPLPLQTHEYLSELNRPQQHKPFDLKATDHHLAFKESFIKEKEFRVLEPHAQHLESHSEKEGIPTFTKTYTAAKQTLETSRAPQSAAQLREAAQLKQSSSGQAKSLESKLHRECDTKSSPSHRKENTKEDNRAQEKRGEREMSDPIGRRDSDKTERDSPHQEKQHKKERDKEEGFGGGQHHMGYQDEEQQEEREDRTPKIDAAYIKEFNDYALQPSILSEIFNMRISQFDVLVLFMEILKLEIKGREQERISRREERELQLAHMQKVVDNYKEQGSFAMKIGIGSGVLGIFSGVLPILGQTNGDQILQFFGAAFESVRHLKANEVFRNLGKITQVMSEMQKRVGEIHHSYSEGDRTYDQHMSDLYRTDWEERTRSIDEIKDSWKGIENFLYQTLQMQHDTIRQLYNF